MWRLALLLVLALSVRAQDDDADRLLTSVRQPVIVEANLPNITVGFKTGPNIPGTQFTIKCVLEGEGCDATPQGQSVSGSLPVKPAAVEGTVQGLEVDQTYSCFVETTLSENGKVSYCQEAMPFPGVVRFELIFGAYPNAAAFGPSEQAQVCANVLSLQPGGTCSVLRVTDGSAIVLIQVEYDDFRNTWSLTETLTQNATAVTAALASGLEGSVEIADVETEPPVPNPLSPTNVAANAASECTPSVVVTWAAPQRSSTITGYFVSCTSLTAPAVNRTVAATQRNTTLSIQAGEEYTCSVVSQGPSGASEPAAAPSPVTYRFPKTCTFEVDSLVDEDQYEENKPSMWLKVIQDSATVSLTVPPSGGPNSAVQFQTTCNVQDKGSARTIYSGGLFEGMLFKDFVTDFQEISYKWYKVFRSDSCYDKDATTALKLNVFSETASEQFQLIWEPYWNDGPNPVPTGEWVTETIEKNSGSNTVQLSGPGWWASKNIGQCNYNLCQLDYLGSLSAWLTFLEGNQATILSDAIITYVALEVGTYNEAVTSYTNDLSISSGIGDGLYSWTYQFVAQ